MTPGRAALVFLMQNYLAGLMDLFVTLLEIHKLLYFLQEAGEPLNLVFKKAPYGPYAENLRKVLNQIEGHYVSGYGDGGDQPGKPIEPLPFGVKASREVLARCQKTQKRVDRVADLVNGFESPFGLELLATVHWVVVKERAKERREVIRSTFAWHHQKQKFSEYQIGIAHDVLTNKGWVSPAPGEAIAMGEDPMARPKV